MQLAFLNHLFAVVDRETADATGRSRLLREVADFTVGTVAAASGERWTGRYLTMRTTYVELFGPGDAADSDGSGPGSLGLAFGGDAPGVIDQLVARAEAAGVALERSLRRRALDGDAIDWFHSAAFPEAATGLPFTLDVWAMEYAPAYFAHTATNKRASAGRDDEVSRERYNAGTYTGKLLEDLAAAEVAIDRDLFAARVRPMLAASGYDLHDRVDGLDARSDETSLFFRFATTSGLRGLRFRLARPVDDVRVETIGRSKLTVGPGREACWTFATTR